MSPLVCGLKSRRAFEIVMQFLYPTFDCSRRRVLEIVRVWFVLFELVRTFLAWWSRRRGFDKRFDGKRLSVNCKRAHGMTVRYAHWTIMMPPKSTSGSDWLTDSLSRYRRRLSSQTFRLPVGSCIFIYLTFSMYWPLAFASSPPLIFHRSIICEYLVKVVCGMCIGFHLVPQYACLFSPPNPGQCHSGFKRVYGPRSF